MERKTEKPMLRRVLEIKGSLYLCLPKKLTQTKGIKKGDWLALQEWGGSLVVSRVPGGEPTWSRP